MMQMTLMSRMTGLNRTMPAAAFASATAANKPKDMNNTGSTTNMASAKTATSMTGGIGKFNETMNGTFKDSTARGIVSGMGLLTFS